MNYYNIHTHLPSDESGLISIRNISADILQLQEWPGGLNDNVYYSLGIHPWYIDEKFFNEQLISFYETLDRPRIVAIGECGLDKLRGPSLDLQEEVFMRQADVAEKLGKSLIIHCVRAWSEIIALKKKLSPTVPWIIHGFRGKKILADQLWDHGFYFSVADNFNPEAITPDMLSRLFVETDVREIHTFDVYQKLAAAFNMNLATLVEQIAKNVHKVFSI